MDNLAPIGIFDSGYGGLTVLADIKNKLPGYDFVYLGDNARSPYGTRSFETVYRFTLGAVSKLFDQGCKLVILACNTASAKALRTIQQKNLPLGFPDKKVLGVIRPTTEIIGNYTKSKRIGVLGTPGTVTSNSYVIEIGHFFPHIKVYQQACPMWVPLVENNEHNKPGADYFIKKYIDALMSQDNSIDTLLLACTHYPLLIDKIKKYAPPGCQVVPQGQIVADSLHNYLVRHPEVESQCSKNGTISFFTSDSTEVFNKQAALFYDGPVSAQFIEIQ